MATGSSRSDSNPTIISGAWLASPGLGPTASEAAAGHSIIAEGAVVVVDSTIIDVGDRHEMARRYPDAVTHHRPSSLLIPGMINAHAHLPMTMFRGLADDIDLSAFLATVIPLEDAVLTAETVSLATELALVESFLAGVTSTLDMYFFHDAMFDVARRLGFRLFAGPILIDPFPGPLVDGVVAADRVERATDWLSGGGDAGLGGGVVHAHSGYLTSPQMLEAAAELSDQFGVPLHVHASESADEVAQIRERFDASPIEHLARHGCVSGRSVLAHCVHATASEIELIAEAGATVSHCPASNLGLASGVAPIPEMVRRGVNVAIGTDGPASSNNLDVRAAGRLAALLSKGTSGDATVLAADDLLARCTVGGALAVGRGTDLGRLLPGYRADVVVVDLSGPHHLPVHEPVGSLFSCGQGSDVTDVWVDGIQRVRDRRVVGVDMPVLADRVSELGMHVRTKVAI